METLTVSMELNCAGMNCPLPILKTKKAIDGLNSGDILKMISTDPGSANDMVAWANRTGNEIVKTEEKGGDFIFYVKKN